MPFLTVWALQGATPSGVLVAPISLWLIQVPGARLASRGVVTYGPRFLPHVSPPGSSPQ